MPNSRMLTIINKIKENKIDIQLFIVMFIIMILASVILPPVFNTNDDVTMRMIVSGAITGIPDGHAVFIMYPLSWLLCLLYKVTNQIDWYSLFFSSAIFLCGFLVLKEIRNILWNEKINRYFTVLLSGIVISMIYLISYIYVQFTVVAAVFGATAIFLFFIHRHRAAAIVFMILCFLIRSDVFLMVLPFWGIVILWKLSDCKGRNQIVKQVFAELKILIVIAVSIVVCLAINHSKYSSDGWKEFADYSNSRVQLYDYTNINYENSKQDMYEETTLSENQIKIIESYNLMLDSEIASEDLNEMAGAWDNTEEMNSILQRIVYIMQKYVYVFFVFSSPYSFIVAFLFLVLGILIGKTKDKKKIFLYVCILMGRCAYVIYLLSLQRLMIRVDYSIYCIVVMMLIGSAVSLLRNEKYSNIAEKAYKTKSKIIIAVCLTILCVFQLIFLGEYERQSIKRMQPWESAAQYCREHSENQYFLDVRSFEQCSGKLFDIEVNNMIRAGCWLTRSPIIEERLETLGVQDVAEALVYCDNTYFVASSDKEVDWMDKYFDERFGNCDMEICDTIKYGEKSQLYVYSIRIIKG